MPLRRPLFSPIAFATQLSNITAVAGDAFLTALVDAASRRREWFREFLRLLGSGWYLEAVGSTGRDATQARIAARFALVYAAGSLAFNFGILPGSGSNASSAVELVMGAVILPTEARAASHAGRHDSCRADLHCEIILNRFIDLASRSKPFTMQDLAAADGIIYHGKKGKIEYLFANQRFRNAVCGGRPAERVVEDLRAGGDECPARWQVDRDARLPAPLGRARAISIKHDIVEHV